MAMGGDFSGMMDFGGLNKGVESFLHPERGYEAAGQQLQQYYRDAQGNLQPYSQNGMNQYDMLMGQKGELNDPGALENKWAAGYTESPYAQQMTKQATASGMDAASSMGLNGSSAALQNIQQKSGDIMQSDRQQYMNDLMQKYMASIGIGQNMYNQGAGAAGQMSKNAMDMGTSMAGAAYGQQNAPGENMGKLAGMVAGML